MSRLQLALNVDDLEVSIAFYSALFHTAPTKANPATPTSRWPNRRSSWSSWRTPGREASVNHLGVEVADTDTVDREQRRLADAGLASVDERDNVCCYAKQDKFWVEGTPNGEHWEIYTVLEDADSMGRSLVLDPAGEAPCC